MNIVLLLRSLWRRHREHQERLKVSQVRNYLVLKASDFELMMFISWRVSQAENLSSGFGNVPSGPMLEAGLEAGQSTTSDEMPTEFDTKIGKLNYTHQ